MNNPDNKFWLKPHFFQMTETTRLATDQQSTAGVLSWSVLPAAKKVLFHLMAKIWHRCQQQTDRCQLCRLITDVENTPVWKNPTQLNNL